jgi:hypothetical protein
MQCGNSTTVTQTINVNDTQAPVVTGTIPASTVEGCGPTDVPAAATTGSTVWKHWESQ